MRTVLRIESHILLIVSGLKATRDGREGHSKFKLIEYWSQVIFHTQIVHHIVFLTVVWEGNSGHLTGLPQVRKC